MNECSECLPVVVLLYTHNEEERNVEYVDSLKTPREDILAGHLSAVLTQVDLVSFDH